MNRQMRASRRNFVIEQPRQHFKNVIKKQQPTRPTISKKISLKKSQGQIDMFSEFQIMPNRFVSIPYAQRSIEKNQKNQDVKNMSIAQKSSSSTSIKNEVRTPRKLIFTPKKLKKNQNLKFTFNLEQGTKKTIKEISNQVKNIIETLKELIKQSNKKIKQFCDFFISNFINKLSEYKIQSYRLQDRSYLNGDDLGKHKKNIQDNEQDNCQNNSALLPDNQYHIQTEAFKVDKILEKYQKLSERVQAIPILDLQSISNTQSREEIVRQYSVSGLNKFSNRFIKRQPKTRRSKSGDNIQFHFSNIATKNFVTFNETLSKMKRLTFGGSIQKR